MKPFSIIPQNIKSQVVRERFVFLFFLLLASFDSFSQSRKLVWADEFDKPGVPDSSRWGYDVGGKGWGNNELQYYTHRRKENSYVKDGHLVIEARNENYKTNKYTSARLVSKNKGDWKYGRIEVKAKLPQGKGMWPAIWMLPTKSTYGGWPKSGEIDIMEFVGYMPDSVFGTVHTEAYNHTIGTQKTKGLRFKDLSTAFHVYAIEWTKDRIDFYVDDQKYSEFRNEGTGAPAWPFDQEFHIILNIAVGGNWGGKYGVDDSVFPQRMLVDYVRVYQ